MKNPFSTKRSAETPAGTAHPDATDAPARKRLVPILAVVAGLAVLGTGAAVAADAHKTVTIDVDGQTTEVTTWRGSVGNLLEEQGITVGERDVVAPSASAALGEGSEIVVRYGREITVADAEGTSTIWTTAVDADEVLASLAARGDQTRLVASRSSDRAAIGIRLPLDGVVALKVDGETREVAAGAEELDDFLAVEGITLGELDRVHVARLGEDGEPAADGQITVVVQRVVVEDQAVTEEIGYESVTENDATRFKDLAVAVQTAGVPGVRTLVDTVTLVDGVEESRERVSDTVTTEPVTEVLLQGTKERPVVTTPAATSSSSSSAAASGGTADQGTAPSGTVWAQLAQCESGGNPSIVSKSGAYHGLYQFSVGTWQSVGGTGLPSQASAEEQTLRAQILQERSGWGQWPHCSAKLGLR